jgi:hypothetical protein
MLLLFADEKIPKTAALVNTRLYALCALQGNIFICYLSQTLRICMLVFVYADIMLHYVSDALLFFGVWPYEQTATQIRSDQTLLTA